MTPSLAKALFERLSSLRNEFLDSALLELEALINLFVSRLHAKEVDSIYIGAHGIPGHSWPPLEDHDGNHMRLECKPREHTCARAQAAEPRHDQHTEHTHPLTVPRVADCSQRCPSCASW